MLSELCVFIATGVRGRIQWKGRVGKGWKKHSNRINLTERNGNAVRSWDRWTITVKCVCVYMCVCLFLEGLGQSTACIGRHIGEND